MGMNMRRLALIFPGQGSQRVGMGTDLIKTWPKVVSKVLDEASETLQLNLQKIMFEGPVDTLTQTQIAQPALLTHSTAILRVLEHITGFHVSGDTVHCVAGHSLGEYSALVAGNAIPFAKAAELVHKRGQFMQDSTDGLRGLMAAIMPIDHHLLSDICALASSSTNGGICQVANYNSKHQAVLSGEYEAVEAAIVIAKEKAPRSRAFRLPVSAPFHCKLMEKAALNFHEYLLNDWNKNGDFCIQKPCVPITWNVTGQFSLEEDWTPANIADILCKQLVSPVRWSDSIDACKEANVSLFVEIGGTNVLTGLVQQHLGLVKHVEKNSVLAQSCSTVEQIKDMARIIEAL